MIAGDLAVIPGWFACKALIGYMMANGEPCDWTKVGAQCGTCGGTRCAQSLLSGDLTAAWEYNPFVFVCFVYLAVSAVLLNLWVVFGWDPAKKVLGKMYNLVTLFIWLGAFFLFVILRNIPFLTRFFAAISALL